jgi:uncharacterized C2H2 Zn-finger protein
MTTWRKGKMSQDKRESATPTPPGSDMPARVQVIPYQEGAPDAAATLQLLQIYHQDDGFHCPRCKVVFEDPNVFVEHLAEEINDAMLKLAAPSSSAEKQLKRGKK